MEKSEFSKQIAEKMQQIKIDLTQNQINQFYTYMQLLIEWNEKMNLTAITEPNEVILKHFVDSATIIKHIKARSTKENDTTPNSEKTKLIDIGTGAGFPGIPIKIIRPDIEIVLLDSLNKRITFLNEVIKKLQLEKITAIHARAEEAGKNKKYREQFDIVTSRAVANMSTLSEYTIPLIKVGGKGIYMKGSEIEEELEKSKKAIQVLGGKIEKVESFNLPSTNIKRNNVIIHKKSTTSGKYPRKPGLAKKEPIQ